MLNNYPTKKIKNKYIHILLAFENNDDARHISFYMQRISSLFSNARRMVLSWIIEQLEHLYVLIHFFCFI
jgi:hypothetical protein